MNWFNSAGKSDKKEDEIDLANIEKELQNVIKDV